VTKLDFDTLSGLWVLKVSDEEVKFLTGGDSTDDENNLKLFHPGCKLMLVTEGGEGCRYYTPVCEIHPHSCFL
jgi:sugar/nucleoside kinase (ribokinase family)